MHNLFFNFFEYSSIKLLFFRCRLDIFFIKILYFKENKYIKYGHNQSHIATDTNDIHIRNEKFNKILILKKINGKKQRKIGNNKIKNDVIKIGTLLLLNFSNIKTIKLSFIVFFYKLILYKKSITYLMVSYNKRYNYHKHN